MLILGVPKNVDPSTLCPTGEWRLSAATQRELTLRAEAVSLAREEASALDVFELRAMVAELLAEEAKGFGGELPPGFPDANTMTRDELLDFVAELTGGFDPELEVVYPGASDPTA